MAEKLKGRIATFTKEQGFGTVELEDGRKLPFDVTACPTVPEQDREVFCEIGVSRLGREKITYLELVGGAEEEATAGPALLPWREALKKLRAEGLLRTLTPPRITEILNDLYRGDTEQAETVPILDAFYGADRSAAAADGYRSYDWRFANNTDDLISDLAAMVGGKPPLETTRWEGTTLHARRYDGAEVSIEVESADDVVDLFNRALAKSRESRRVFPLATDGDWHAYMLLPIVKARRLTDEGVLPIRWNIAHAES